VPLYSFLLLFAAMTGFVFSFIVFLYGKEKYTKNSLAIYNLLFALWCLCQFLGEISYSKSIVLFWTRVNLLFAVLIPYSYLIFVYSFSKSLQHKKFQLFLFGVLTLFLLVFLPTRFFVNDLYSTSFYRYYPKGGIVYILYLFIFIIQVLTGFFELLKQWAASTASRKNQFAYITLASIIGFGGGILWFLPAFGVDIYPFGILITPFYLIVGAYAVVKHRLLDIKIVIGKGIVYSIIIALFTAFYIVLTATLIKIFQVDYGFAAATIVLLFFSLFFDYLRRNIQHIIDKILFGRSYDYSSVIKELSYAMASSLTLQQIGVLSTKNISEILDISKAALYIYDEQNDRFSLFNKFGEFVELSQTLSKKAFRVALNNLVFLEDVADDGLSDFMRKNNFILCLPILQKNDLKGLIFLGDKNKRSSWRKEDFDLLETFAVNLYNALNNILLSEKIMNDQFEMFRDEKKSAISIMAGEIAHEIKNPLTSIRGLMQIFPQKKDDTSFLDDFMEIMPRQIDKISIAVNRLINFERKNFWANQKDRNNLIDVFEVINEVLIVFIPQINAQSIKCTIEKKYPLKIHFVKEDFERVIFNLVINAIQAMPNGGILSFEIDKNKLKITDSGFGIEPNYIEKIFEPFFTLKSDGAGLGLAIVKKILEDNKVKISVNSKVGQGTTFELDFLQNFEEV